MQTKMWHETFEEQRVTYTLLKDGKLFVIENVPARVNTDTGEQLFSPQTVEKIQGIILGKQVPVRVIQAPVFEFAG